MLLYDSFAIALRYSVKLPFSQFARAGRCWNRTKPSLGNDIERNWCVCAEHCAKNGHNTSIGTKKWFYSITTLGLTLPNPSYSPDIAPSDFYLFQSMAHGLADQQFCSYEDIEKWLDSWIASKDEHFYRNGIRVLPERWAKVVANDNQSFEWFICNHFFTIKLHFHKKNSGNLVAHLIIAQNVHFNGTTKYVSYHSENYIFPQILGTNNRGI